MNFQIAKRDNNQKRTFLLVNTLQGKHLPVSPSKAFSLFEELYGAIPSLCRPDEHLLVIGFAETATAIGGAFASCVPKGADYIHTTRESIPGRQYLYFSEEHSHATVQKLDRDFLDKVLSNKTRVVFVEDEVTTGNTIRNIVERIRQAYPQYRLQFTVASILNGMTEEQILDLKEQSVDFCFLEKVPALDYDTVLSGFCYHPELRTAAAEDHSGCPVLSVDCGLDPRQGVKMPEYNETCRKIAEQLTEELHLRDGAGQNILILGTEEFMYPGLFWGRYLEQNTGHTVTFHATTRSPILPSSEPDYPLHRRIQLESFYECGRTTYLYNPDFYDQVFILTDSPVETPAISQVCRTFRDCRCQHLTQVIWRNS